MTRTKTLSRISSPLWSERKSDITEPQVKSISDMTVLNIFTSFSLSSFCAKTNRGLLHSTHSTINFVLLACCLIGLNGIGHRAYGRVNDLICQNHCQIIWSHHIYHNPSHTFLRKINSYALCNNAQDIAQTFILIKVVKRTSEPLNCLFILCK